MTETALVDLRTIQTELERGIESPNRDLAITLVQAAQQALIQANTPAEAVDVRNRLRAFEVWFKKQRAQLIDSNLVVAQRLRTERTLGEMLAATVSAGRPGKLYPEGTILPDGISPKESSKWQRVKDIDEDDFEMWVQENLNSQELSTAALLRFWAEMFAPAPLDPPPPPQGQYRCIVIDPPWPIERILREERPLQPRALDYRPMTIEEISAQPVRAMAPEDGCHLYLWVTQKYLPDGLKLVKDWGFEYECLMTWIKPTGFTPYSWMYNTEHVIFARRGNMPLATLGLKLSFEAPVEGHSVKPSLFYERVAAASPEPRIDMFARSKHEGFKPWGDEVNEL